MHCTYSIYDLHYNGCSQLIFFFFFSTRPLPSYFVTNDETSVLLLFSLLSMYCSTAFFEKIGSVTISVSLLLKWMKSVKSGSLLGLLHKVKTFLDHLYLALPGNFNSNLHMTYIMCIQHIPILKMDSIFKLHQEFLEFLICFSITSFDLWLIFDFLFISRYVSVRVTISLIEQLFGSFKSNVRRQLNAIFCHFSCITCCILNQ